MRVGAVFPPGFCNLWILEFRDFADFRILRISSFAEFEIPCRSRALPRQRHAGEEAVREARGCAAVCLERVSARPTMPAMPHDRSGATLGKSKISDFGILVVRFGPPLPFLVLSCVQSLPVGGTLQIFAEFTRKYRFLTPTQSGNGAGGHGVAQGASPVGLCRHNTHCTTINLQNHEKSLKIIKKH